MLFHFPVYGKKPVLSIRGNPCTARKAAKNRPPRQGKPVISDLFSGGIRLSAERSGDRSALATGKEAQPAMGLKVTVTFTFMAGMAKLFASVMS